jgi:hypothetical protein
MNVEPHGQQRQVPRPATDDPVAWRAYWVRQEQPWRYLPEISQERQEELQQRLGSITPTSTP